MYSILLSKMEALELLKNRCINILKSNSKVVILPWAFPTELNSDKLMNEYFVKTGNRYKKYIKQLKNFGILESNIKVGDCYLENHQELDEIIENSDIIVLPGGNPEMLMSKILHQTELFYKIKHYKGIIIGESAGCLLQQERYFIMPENNYYAYFAFYDGIGVIRKNTPFLLDVHSKENREYIEKLQEISNKNKKDIYAIYDDGAILYNRNTLNCELFGKVKKISFNNHEII